MATIIERNGRFLARVRRKGFPPVSQTFHRRGDAATWGRQVEADMEGGRWIANHSSAAFPTFRQAIATYQQGAGSSLKGAETYAYWLSDETASGAPTCKASPQQSGGATCVAIQKNESFAILIC